MCKLKNSLHTALQPPEKPLSSSARSGHNIPERLMSGREIPTTLRGFLITEVPFVRLCTPRMLSKVSNPVSVRSRKKERFQTKTHSSNCSVSELPSSTKSGTAARFKTELWSEIISQLTTKSSAHIEKYEHLI